MILPGIRRATNSRPWSIGWRVRIPRSGDAYARHFRDARHGGPVASLAAACKYMVEECNRRGLIWSKSVMSVPKKPKQFKFGPRKIEVVRTQWRNKNGRICTKMAAIGKHGLERALEIVELAQAEGIRKRLIDNAVTRKDVKNALHLVSVMEEHRPAPAETQVIHDTYGERNGATRLSEGQVKNLRRDWPILSVKELENKYHMSYRTIWQIATGRTWKACQSPIRKRVYDGRGHKNPRCVLSISQAMSIKEEWSHIPTKQLARKYNVSESTIWRIGSGKSWKNL